MSYNTHKRFALDVTKPFLHRASHARSCTNHVADKLHVSRDEIIERVMAISGVNLIAPSTGEELERALGCLDQIRFPEGNR